MGSMSLPRMKIDSRLSKTKKSDSVNGLASKPADEIEIIAPT